MFSHLVIDFVKDYVITQETMIDKRFLTDD